MTIRNATVNDLDRLIAVRMDFLETIKNPMTADEKERICMQLREYFPRHLSAGDFIAVLAEEDGKLCASAYLMMVEKPANQSFPNGRTGTILNVFTYPEYRRRGIAGQVLLNLIWQAKLAGLSQLELTATQAGRPLYEKLGFALNDCPSMRLRLTDRE